jgi:DNA primase
MVNSHNNPVQGRKEGKQDFHQYVDDLKSRLDIVSVAQFHGISIDEHGRANCFKGHDNKTPSLAFYEDTQRYYCFGCKSHGDVISLVQAITGCSFGQALQSLASEAGMRFFEGTSGFDAELYGRVSDCLRSAAQIYHSWLVPEDPYLAARGIAYQTAQKFLVGRTRGNDHLRRALEERGVTAESMIFSGLVKTDCMDFFQDHIVVPIMTNGRVVDFYGRSLNGNQDHRHWRLPNNRTVVGHGLFNLNLRGEEIILTEGVFDAMSLIQHGFPYAAAAFGTQGLKDEYLQRIGNSRIKRVFICYDGDDSGRKAALRDGIAVEDAGKEVRIIRLPDNMDPNEFIQAYPNGDLQSLIAQAPSPAEVQIEHIASLQSQDDRNMAMNTLLARCEKMQPVKREGVIDMAAKALGMTKKLLRDQMVYLSDQAATEPQVTGNPEEITNSKAISPALDIVDGTIFMTVQRLMRDPEDGSPKWTPWVVTSNPEWFPLERNELHRRGYHTMADERGFYALQQRYAPRTVRDFVKGKRTGDLARTYADIRGTLRQYLDFPDPNTHDFLTAWIIGTYCYVVFNYYPYVHFNGTKLVGKSKALKLLACLSFNGIWCVSISEAAQFRLIESLQLTLCLDETEDLNQKQIGEKRSLLLGGYEKGSRVYRSERRGDSFVPRAYNNYSPRAMASIEGLEDVLGSRTVQIQMERSYNDEIKQREIALTDPALQELRDELFLVAMTYGADIQAAYESMEKPEGLHFGDREYNILKPILAVGAVTGSEEIMESLKAFANASYRQKVDEHNESAEENILLRYLMGKIVADGEYRSDDLHAGFIQFIRGHGLDMQVQMSKGRMAKLMIKLKVCEKGSRATDRTATNYYFSRDSVIRVAKNYQVN